MEGNTLGERCAHDNTAHAGRSLEMLLSALSPAGVQLSVDLRHFGGGGRRCRRGVVVVVVVAGRHRLLNELFELLHLNSKWAAAGSSVKLGPSWLQIAARSRIKPRCFPLRDSPALDASLTRDSSFVPLVARAFEGQKVKELLSPTFSLAAGLLAKRSREYVLQPSAIWWFLRPSWQSV